MELLHISTLQHFIPSLTPLLCYPESLRNSFCQYHVNIVYDLTPPFSQNFISKFNWTTKFWLPFCRFYVLS